MTVLVKPNTANFAGNVQGGTILEFLVQVAYAFASCYAGHCSGISQVRKQRRHKFGKNSQASRSET